MRRPRITLWKRVYVNVVVRIGKSEDAEGVPDPPSWSWWVTGEIGISRSEPNERKNGRGEVKGWHWTNIAWVRCECSCKNVKFLQQGEELFLDRVPSNGWPHAHTVLGASSFCHASMPASSLLTPHGHRRDYLSCLSFSSCLTTS